MTNWNERMRQVQEAARQATDHKQAKITLEQHNEKVKLQGAAELRSITERQEEESRLKYFEALDALRVKEMLESIKHEVWQDRGVVSEDSRDVEDRYRSEWPVAEKFVKLSFDYQTTIPEIETKKWDVKVGEGYEHVEFSGGHTYAIKEERSKTKVVKEYRVVKPSYLEVGVDVTKTGKYATLYILDTEVDLPTEDKTFSDLARKTGVRFVGRLSRTIKYTDTKGNMFDKQPRPTDYGNGSGWLTGRDIHTSHSLANSHTAVGVEIDLGSEPDIKALKNFVTYGLTLSCFLRKSQNKLPLQLK